LPIDQVLSPEFARPLDDYAERWTFSAAKDLLALLQTAPFNNGQWAFRGHTRAEYRLQPSLERIVDPVHFPLSEAEELVSNLFRARAHHYITNLPKEDDDLEWLSLMRHHGAPTRLLDWTVSPYVAAFFATHEPTPASFRLFEPVLPRTTSAIWAINAVLLKKEATRIIGGQYETTNHSAKLGSRNHFNRIFLMRNEKLATLVAPVRPVRMNERLTVQRGLFLCANRLDFDFEAIMKKMLSDAYARGDAKLDWLHKLEIEPSARLDLLTELRRMNITYGSLFPGLDGFARSLQTYIEIKAHLSTRPIQVDDVV
jgi:hypothetical protein